MNNNAIIGKEGRADVLPVESEKYNRLIDKIEELGSGRFETGRDFEYVKKQYGTIPEYLWKESPESAVLRHKNGKWYAVLMQVEKSRLGLEGDTEVDIIDVKCNPDMVGLLAQDLSILPGYHMNKKYWITMLLDGTVSDEESFGHEL